jgi:hypothetical protein
VARLPHARCWFEVRVEWIAATNDDVPDVAYHALVLATLVEGLLPTEEVAIEGHALLVVGRAERRATI